MPRGAGHIHGFSFFNAITFQIITGAPLILFAKSLGATSTVLGVMTAFAPLMTIFQLPAARFLPVYGYKSLVLAGWGIRTVFIVLMAAIPMADFLDAPAKLVLMAGLLLVFNFLRGASSAAWMPWMASLIPEEEKARFLSRDQVFMLCGSLVALVTSSLVMGGEAVEWEYSLVFGISAAAGGLSLWFLRRVPDVAAPELMRTSSEPVPWRAMIGHPPFHRLLVFNLLYVLVVGSLGVFTVEYLHELPGFDLSEVLFLTAVSFCGALILLPPAGRLLDVRGCRVVLMLALGMFALVIAGWFCLSTGLLPGRRRYVAALNFLSGAAGAVFNVANARVMFATMPAMGRNHFFALFTVITSLGLGASPVTWGVILDWVGSFEWVTGSLEWHRHSFYFAVLFVLNLVTLWRAGSLQDTRL